MLFLFVCLLIFVPLCSAEAVEPSHDRMDSAKRLKQVSPEAVGMRGSVLERIDQVVAEGLRRKSMPGAVVLVARRNQTVYLKAFGMRQLLPKSAQMTIDTVFDMASLTKPLATAMSVMKLIDDGRLRLEDPVAKHLPEFGVNGKDSVTILQLLTHQGGLIPDIGVKEYDDGPAKSLERMCELKLHYPPGTRLVYTDVGFMILAEVVQRVSNRSVHEFSHENVFAPLGMMETGFLPNENLRQRAAPTERREDRWMRGEVHDPRAYRLGGVAGHAGLFSTAEDLAVFGAMMTSGGTLDDVTILRPDNFRQMTAAYPIGSYKRGLGWDKQSPYSYNGGDLLSDSAFGHGGFTGTVMWMDPELELTFIFLSNRVHPDGSGSVNRLAGRVATIAAAAIAD